MRTATGELAHAGLEEQRASAHRGTAGEDDTLEPAVDALEANDRLSPQGDIERSQRRALVARRRRPAAGEEDDVLAPADEGDGELVAVRPRAVRRQRLIAELPAVAVWTVEDAPTVQRLEPLDRGDVVLDAGCEQQGARVDDGLALSRCTVKWPPTRAASTTAWARTAIP